MNFQKIPPALNKTICIGNASSTHQALNKQRAQKLILVIYLIYLFIWIILITSEKQNKKRKFTKELEELLCFMIYWRQRSVQS